MPNRLFAEGLCLLDSGDPEQLESDSGRSLIWTEHLRRSDRQGSLFQRSLTTLPSPLLSLLGTGNLIWLWESGDITILLPSFQCTTSTATPPPPNIYRHKYIHLVYVKAPLLSGTLLKKKANAIFNSHDLATQLSL